MKRKTSLVAKLITTAIVCSYMVLPTLNAQAPAVPSNEEVNRPFGGSDVEMFRSPSKVYHPQTWFHYIGGNVAAKGITADLEAIAGAGISGIQLFHGQFGGPWPGVEPQIACLSPLWDAAVRHTAEECRRLGLRFTMQNCPGWAMSGGPWIEPSNAMRHLVWSRIDFNGGSSVNKILPLPQPSDEDWRDYKDITVLAFPTPLDDNDKPLIPQSLKSNRQDLPWMESLVGSDKGRMSISPVAEGEPNWIEVTFANATPLRTVELSSINGYNHGWCFEPGVKVRIEAVLADGSIKEILSTDLPQSNWQDRRPISLACSEVKDVKTYRISISNKHQMALNSLRLFSAARKNNWESEAGWTLRSLVRAGENPVQSPAAFIDPGQIHDITSMMDKQGNLKWDVPSGKWTILRIGHVNTGMKNGPAPAEGTGWECDKLSVNGSNVQFASYLGKLSKNDGPIGNGLLNGMLMDSWECETQTWTNDMEAEFGRISGYQLRKWLPAVFGYVIGDHEISTRFLRDWRGTIGTLFSEKFYGNMAKLAKENNMSLTYETAAGDVFPADILEYFKHADVPMCEFWHPMSESFVGSLNFKSIKPTASAARLYGKPRVAAEAFTSFALSWDEHLSMLKEVANINAIEGVTHLVFHTYTHNPRTDFLPPGTSFGSGIGTPFLRGQTWWKHMPEFTDYLARCNYLLERGKSVSDVLWYLGDEINHKPDQNAPFPTGFKYDYCNPDILLNRLTVRDGMLTTPEGTSYRVLWLPDIPRMLPQTLEKLYALVRDGATIIGDAPQGLATLIDAENAQQRFDKAVKNIWGNKSKQGIRKVGKGTVISGTELSDALNQLKMNPDVTGGDALWLHRRIEGADWYYVCPPQGKGFQGTLDFRSSGNVELWDPVTGEVTAPVAKRNGNRTKVSLDLPQAGSCFVVFRHSGKTVEAAKGPTHNRKTRTLPFTAVWNLSFPSGWDAPSSLQLAELKAWKDLDISPEAKAFSGSATYTTTFDAGEVKDGMRFSLDLGKVEMIAVVSVNGKPVRTLWTYPYCADLTDFVESGKNTLTVEVTSTWFNRLVYDAGQPEEKRKTWTISGPSKDAQLRDSGLLGPVVLSISE
ncbi:MAG: glycosyl hydrolase [Dysgonomonas sp.]